MSTAALTKPRTLNHDAAKRIINSARPGWQTWLAACLFPCKLYVAFAFIWVVKAYVDYNNRDSWDTASIDPTNIAMFVVTGYFLCLLVLTFGACVQLYTGSDRAGSASAVFAVSALIISFIIMCYASNHPVGIGVREMVVRTGPY